MLAVVLLQFSYNEYILEYFSITYSLKYLKLSFSPLIFSQILSASSLLPLLWVFFLNQFKRFLLFPSSIYVALGFGVIFGLLWLATIPPTNGIVAQIFGTKYLTTLFGIVFFSHQMGSFLGAYLGGYFYDQFGSYNYAWYLSILLSVFAGLVHLPIDEKPIVRVAPINS